MVKPIKFREYFLLLLPIFFVLHGYNENYPLIKARVCLELLFTYFIVFGGFGVLFYFVFGSWRKTAAFILLMMCFHFFFGNIHSGLKSIFHNVFTRYTYILPLSIIFFIAAIVYLRKTKREFNRLTRYANLLFLIFIAFDVFQLAVKFTGPTNSSPPPNNCSECSKPDIYFIVADEYAGQKELSEIFHFDNSVFENALRQRGFFVIDSSRSNYNYTPHSVASILSMNYLKNIEGRNQSKKDRNICYHKINNNLTIDLLKSQGYVLKNFSVFTLNNELPLAFSPFILSGKDLLTSQTFLSRLDRDIRFNLISTYKIKSEMERLGNMQLSSVNYLIDKTKSEVTEKSTQPKFVYTHLMMPHYPYLLDKNGNRTDPEMVLEGTQVKQKEYIEYLQYANNRYLELIDFILKNSSKPPVIILMGDHGFRHFTTNVSSKYYFMNFNSVYLPSKDYSRFYNGISGVNELRVLFNTLFYQRLPLLKDSSIFLRE